MISEDAITDILGQYRKFGWELERVILSPALRSVLKTPSDVLFDGCEVAESEIDAAWFSRLNANGRTAWELRSLTAAPFALVESTGPDPTAEELSELFQRVEDQMRERVIRPRGN